MYFVLEFKPERQRLEALCLLAHETLDFFPTRLKGRPAQTLGGESSASIGDGERFTQIEAIEISKYEPRNERVSCPAGIHGFYFKGRELNDLAATLG